MNQNNSNKSNNNNDDTNGITGRTGGIRYTTNKYCHSCGAWNQDSKDCFRKGQNHKD